MKLVSIFTTEGEVHVNPAHVVAVVPHPHGHELTTLLLSGGWRYETYDNAVQVEELLSAATT